MALVKFPLGSTLTDSWPTFQRSQATPLSGTPVSKSNVIISSVLPRDHAPVNTVVFGRGGVSDSNNASSDGEVTAIGVATGWSNTSSRLSLVFRPTLLPLSTAMAAVMTGAVAIPHVPVTVRVINGDGADVPSLFMTPTTLTLTSPRATSKELNAPLGTDVTVNSRTVSDSHADVNAPDQK